MSAQPVPRISSAEYLRAERLARSKSEYHDGTVVAMSGASRVHNQIVRNLTGMLYNQLAGGRCNNYASDMRVSVRKGRFYLYPDVVVTCGEEEFEDGRFDTLVNPVVVFEILSRSTERYDRGAKFLAYQSIASLREYVLVTQSPRRFEVFRRGNDGAWSYQCWAFSPPPLVLESIGCTLNADDVYHKTEAATTDDRPETQHDEPDAV